MAESLITQLTQMSRRKSYARLLSEEVKNKVLIKLSEKIKTNSSEILKFNKIDLDDYKKSVTYQKAFEDRLTLTDKRIQQMVEGLRVVSSLKDLVGEVADQKILENGLKLKRIRSPLGVIFLIFESRPNVITEAFALAFKTGNSLILKGGKESKLTNQILYRNWFILS